MVWMCAPLAVLDAPDDELSHDRPRCLCAAAGRRGEKFQLTLLVLAFYSHPTRCYGPRHRPDQVKDTGSAGRDCSVGVESTCQGAKWF